MTKTFKKNVQVQENVQENVQVKRHLKSHPRNPLSIFYWNKRKKDGKMYQVVSVGKHLLEKCGLRNKGVQSDPAQFLWKCRGGARKSARKFKRSARVCS
jgi:hypothetical protein